MRKIIPVLFSIALSSVVFADPIPVKVSVICPLTNPIRDAIANYGSYVAGEGQLNVQQASSSVIYFKSQGNLPGRLPNDLNTYDNFSAAYNANSGEVICSFRSNDPQYPLVSVSYILTNGKGGTITAYGNDYLDISLPVGVH